MILDVQKMKNSIVRYKMSKIKLNFIIAIMIMIVVSSIILIIPFSLVYADFKNCQIIIDGYKHKEGYILTKITNGKSMTKIMETTGSAGFLKFDNFNINTNKALCHSLLLEQNKEITNYYEWGLNLNYDLFGITK